MAGFILGQTTRIILIFLASFDLLVNLLGLFFAYAPHYWKWYHIYGNTWACRIINIIVFGTSTASNWYIAVLTFERFLVVWFPLKASDEHLFICHVFDSQAENNHD